MKTIIKIEKIFRESGHVPRQTPSKIENLMEMYMHSIFFQFTAQPTSTNFAC